MWFIHGRRGAKFRAAEDAHRISDEMPRLVSSLIWHFQCHRLTDLYCKMQGVWQGHRTCMLEKTYYTGMVLKRKRRHIISKNFFLQLGDISEDGGDVPDLKGENEL